MASSQNSKEAAHRPCTWEHGCTYISPKQMEVGGGRRQIPVKTLALSKMYFFCFSLSPSAFLADGTCIICPPSSLPSHSSSSHPWQLNAPIWQPPWVKTGRALGRPPSGDFWSLRLSIPGILLGLLFGPGAVVKG